MPKLRPSHAWRLAVLAVLLGVVAGGARAGEEFRPGKFRGVHRVDRWGQGIFSRCFSNDLFVDPAVRPRLQPYAGIPVDLEVTKVTQVINPGPGVLREIGAVTHLPHPVEVQIQWTGDVGPSRSDHAQVAAGTDVAVEVTVLNRGGTQYRLGGDEDLDLGLQFAAHHFWAEQNRPGGATEIRCVPFPLSPAKEFAAGYFSVPLMPADSRIDFQSKVDVHTLPREERPILGPGQRMAWTLTFRGLPANEYELMVMGALRERDADPYVPLTSGSLRLDVLSEEEAADDGLRVDLARSVVQPTTPEGIALTGTLQNVGAHSLHLRVWSREFHEGLYAYDGEGRLLRRRFGTGREVEQDDVRIDLNPGEQQSFHLEADPSAVLARWVVLYHALPKDPVPQGRAMTLETRVWASRHVRLPR